jgi:hypothetical protein
MAWSNFPYLIRACALARLFSEDDVVGSVCSAALHRGAQIAARNEPGLQGGPSRGNPDIEMATRKWKSRSILSVRPNYVNNLKLSVQDILTVL